MQTTPKRVTLVRVVLCSANQAIVAAAAAAIYLLFTKQKSKVAVATNVTLHCCIA